MNSTPGGRRTAERRPSSALHAVNAAIKAHSSHTENLAAITRRTAQQLHETLSYADIAALLGISRARAQQLAGPGRAHRGASGGSGRVG